jgi:uncharacterized protein with GYD domain
MRGRRLTVTPSGAILVSIAIEAILLIRNEPGAAAGMLASGSRGATSQRAALKAFGGRAIFQRAVLGRFDAVVAAEFPSEDALVAFGLAASSAGQYVETLVAISPKKLDAARDIAASAAEAQSKRVRSQRRTK